MRGNDRSEKELLWSWSLAAVAAVLLSWPAGAQTEATAAPAEDREEEEQQLETVRGEIVVTATLPELETDLELAGRQLEAAGAQDVAGYFRGVGGMSAVRRGPINLEPTIRGLQEAQVAMLVDGTRTFAAGPARMDSDLSHVDTHMVQKVKVVKGPYALTWGAGTLSAIELVTHRPPFTAEGTEWGGAARLGYASNGDRGDGHGALWRSAEKVRFRLDFAHREGGDYDDGDGRLVPGDYEASNARWSLGFRPSEGSVLEGSGGYQEQFDLDYPGRILDATYFYTRSYALEWSTAELGGLSELFAQVYSNRKDHRMNNDAKPTAQPNPNRVPPFALRVDLPTEANTTGGRLRAGLARGAVDWTFGADFYRLEQTATRSIFRRDNGVLLFEDAVWPDAEIDDLGGYGQLVWSGERSRVGASLRLDAVDASASGLSAFFLANTTGERERSETHLSAAVSGSFEAGEHWVLSAGVGRSVRPPTVLELYSDRFPSTRFQIAAEFMGDPGLEAEESLQLDVGARARWGELGFQVDLYHRTIDDYVTVVADPSLPKRLPLSPPVVYRYVNGEATFYGGEMRLDHRLSRAFSWRAGLSWVHGEDEAFDEPALGMPPLTGELGVRWRGLGQKLWVDLGARFFDRQDRVARQRFEQETPSFTTVDLAASYRLSERLALSAGVENLGDEAYSHHLNSPNPFTSERIREPGRSYRLGVELGF